MKRVGASFFGVVVVCAAHACTRYVIPEDSPATDAGSDGQAPPPTPPSDAAQQPDAFVPEQVPEWRPSWAGDAGLDDVTADIAADCPEFPATGGTLSGTYRFSQVCFSEAKFREPFQSACPGIRVNNGKAKARVNGTIGIPAANQLTRTGTLYTAAEIIAPCRTQAQEIGGDDSCGSLGTFVAFQLRSAQPEATTTLNCYDTSPTECTCQLEIIQPFDGVAVDYDPAGTFDDGAFKFGLSGNTLRYTGISKTAFDLDPAMTWTLTAL